MTISVVGGLDRLKREYINAGRKKGVKTKVILKRQANMQSVLDSSDAIILLTSNIGHSVASKARNISKSNSVPILNVHNCSVKSVESAIEQCVMACESCEFKGCCPVVSQ